ncbi:MAG: hypothetical protein ACRCWQ_13430 [Bacilli bacterium]
MNIMKKFINVPFIIIGIIAAILFYIVFTSPEGNKMSLPIGMAIIVIGILFGTMRKKK